MEVPKQTEEATFGKDLQPWAVHAARFFCAMMIIVGVLWNIDLPQYLGFAWVRESFFAIFFGLTLVPAFLLYRLNRNLGQRVPWYDVALGVIAIVVLIYVGINFTPLKEGGFANYTTEVVILGGIILALALEALRRTAGYLLLVVVGLFLVYAVIGHQVPGQFQAPRTELWKLFANVGFNEAFIFGIPLLVATSIVAMFILFGQVLIAAGGGQFFTDLAMATMGRRRGGAAKISVMGSALFGTVSGAAVANVASTGVITIPMMQQHGYKAKHAGAIEAVASTGGQLMPPIMGAAAFLMAEFLEIPYADIVIAAIIPSILYYFAVFVQVDLIAGRDGISVIQERLPEVLKVLARGWYFVLPFVVLLVALFEFNQPPETAAIYATGLLLLGSMIFRYEGQRIEVTDLYEVIARSGRVVLGLVVLVASAGIVIGVLSLSGLGQQLAFFLSSLAEGNLFIILLIGAITSIVLGMGMPTAAAYILLAGIIAPGVQDALPYRWDEPIVSGIAAHMFVLYFGMMSMLTPPIALSAFTAAAISKTEPMATALVSMRFGWVAFVVPFLFVYSPTLLFHGETQAVIVDTLTAALGVYLVSVGFVGFFRRKIGWTGRILFLIAGLAAMFPFSAMDSTVAGYKISLLISITGVIIGTLGLAAEYWHARRTQNA